MRLQELRLQDVEEILRLYELHLGIRKTQNVAHEIMAIILRGGGSPASHRLEMGRGVEVVHHR